MVLYGRDSAKLIFIISDRHEAITVRLLEDLDIGVTYISGEGAYSGKDKKVNTRPIPIAINAPPAIAARK